MVASGKAILISTVADPMFPCLSLIALNLAETGCDICGITVTGLKAKGGSQDSHRLVVDHDHITGNIRGMLCDRCNGSLGWIDKYLQKKGESGYEQLFTKPLPKTSRKKPLRLWFETNKEKIIAYLNKPQVGAYKRKGVRNNYRKSRTGARHSRLDRRADKISARKAERMVKRATNDQET